MASKRKKPGKKQKNLARKVPPFPVEFREKMSYGQELCMEKLGGDPFFFDSIHKFDSFYYFSQALRTM
jgi:hypothetical protein